MVAKNKIQKKKMCTKKRRENIIRHTIILTKIKNEKNIKILLRTHHKKKSFPLFINTHTYVTRTLAHHKIYTKYKIFTYVYSYNCTHVKGTCSTYTRINKNILKGLLFILPIKDSKSHY